MRCCGIRSAGGGPRTTRRLARRAAGVVQIHSAPQPRHVAPWVDGIVCCLLRSRVVCGTRRLHGGRRARGASDGRLRAAGIYAAAAAPPPPVPAPGCPRVELVAYNPRRRHCAIRAQRARNHPPLLRHQWCRLMVPSVGSASSAHLAMPPSKLTTCATPAAASWAAASAPRRPCAHLRRQRSRRGQGGLGRPGGPGSLPAAAAGCAGAGMLR